MVNVFLAPKVVWSEGDFCFEDNTVKSYVEKADSSWGLLMELPAVPSIGQSVYVSSWGEDCYRQLKEYLRLPSSSVNKFINAYRFHKNIKGEEMSWGEDNPELGRYDNEDLLAALCYSRLADSLTAHLWKVTNVFYIPNSEIVFVECMV